MTLNELKEKDPRIWLKAIANAHHLNRIVEGDNNISALFVFAEAKEGYDYWNSVRNEEIIFNPDKEVYAKFYWTYNKKWVYVKITISSSNANYLYASLYRIVGHASDTEGTFDWKEIENFELIHEATFNTSYYGEDAVELPNTEFKVGDRVECIQAFEVVKEGVCGVIVDIETRNPPVGVEWDIDVGGHSCDGKAKHGYGYYVYSYNIKLIESKRNIAVVKNRLAGEYYYFKFNYDGNDTSEIICKWAIPHENTKFIKPLRQEYVIGYCCTADIEYEARLATPEEREWLDRCIIEGKYVDKESTTEKDILSEAKRKYPIGTKFYPAHMGTRDADDYCIVTDDSEFVLEDGDIVAKINGSRWDSTSSGKYGNTDL